MVQSGRPLPVCSEMYVAWMSCTFCRLTFFLRSSWPNHFHRQNAIAAAAEETRSTIRAASRSTRIDVTEDLGRRRRVAQNQNVDARPSWTTVPSQCTIGFPPPTPEPTPANVQVNQVAGPSRLPLAPLQHIAPRSFLAAPVSTILCG